MYSFIFSYFFSGLKILTLQSMIVPTQGASRCSLLFLDFYLRCGGAGMLVCCDFCHLVFHPKCLEVTPALSSLFACPDCKEARHGVLAVDPYHHKFTAGNLLYSAISRCCDKSCMESILLSFATRKFSLRMESFGDSLRCFPSRIMLLCPIYLQEAANLFWELQTRNVTASFLEGGLPGLRALLRAADGRGGNAGVVDLMLRCA